MTSEDNKPVPPASIKPDARPAFAASAEGDDTIASHPTGMMAAGAPSAALADDHDSHWREQHPHQPYGGSRGYDDYAAAYRYGEQARQQHPGRPFDELEAELSAGWPEAAGPSGMDWATASPAVRAAMERQRS